MKHILFSLLILASASAYAQTPGDLFARFKNEQNAEYTHVGKLLFKLLRPFVSKSDEDQASRTAFRAIRSIRSLDLEDCSQAVKQQFAQSINNLRTKGYEEIVSSNTDGERTLLLMRQKRNAIRELLILSTGNDECSLVQIKGKINTKDVGNIVGNIK